MKYIIWDWNGTILDDLQLCIDITNGMLEEHGLPAFKNTDDYRQVFTFPIRNYYTKIGFDFDKVPFETIAEQFINLYQPQSLNCPLTKDVTKIMETLRIRGYKQIILSASSQERLDAQVHHFGVNRYVEEILGLNNIWAASKIELAQHWIKNHKTDEIVVIGDTLHDWELAQTIQADCLLFTKGHQIHKSSSDYILFNSMEDLLDYL
ncbi:HAD family hydrolase [Spirochaeta cellobiosiphila]|uniref:HAD family hydrolase n=1 Tax=Spirochaeta cellobiosiphila TaxID=504483 RepID=UPI0004130FF2|nr:HAD hydrolase-like protein [Spirochaeta cellobiosiphila]